MDVDVVVRRASVAEILSLRHRELRPGLPVESARFDGDDEPATLHYGAWSAELVGCASFMRPSDADHDAYQLRGMATRADCVRRGVGTRLLSYALDDVCAATGVTHFWCNARIAALSFYVSQGWSIASPVFEIPGVGPHRRMAHDVTG